MSEMPRAVRAWAEYDEWSVLLDGIGDALERGVDYFTSWEMPKGAEGFPQQFPGMLPFEHWIALMAHGPLRAIRILLSTGHAVELVRKADSVTIAQALFVGMIAVELGSIADALAALVAQQEVTK